MTKPQDARRTVDIMACLGLMMLLTTPIACGDSEEGTPWGAAPETGVGQSDASGSLDIHQETNQTTGADVDALHHSDGELESDGVNDDSVDMITPDAPSPYMASPPDPVAYSGGSCPTFSDGTNTLQSDAKNRSIEVSLPDDPTGAPVLFIFHGSGDNPGNMMSFFGATSISATRGAIVVAPKGVNGVFGWPFSAFDDPTPDLTLFDDLIACLDEQFDIDNRRIYSTGFSAGALWTTFLLTKRGEYLASAVTFSGGVGLGVSYETPGYNLPVLVVWGGTNDTYGGGGFTISFQDESENLIQNLTSDGHFVGKCDHGGGHTVPFGGSSWAQEFLFAHTWNDGSSPFQEEVPDGVFPEYCEFP